MQTDKKQLNWLLVLTLAVLLLVAILPFGASARVVCALVMVPIVVLQSIVCKKRDILSINKSQVWMILATCALLFVMGMYLFGLRVGFARSYRFSLSSVFLNILPIAVIIVSTEHLRSVSLAQKNRLAGVLSFFAILLCDILICSRLTEIGTFNRFMDVVGLTLMPAVVENLLFHYLVKRYGVLPNITYRAIMGLYAYLIPYVPAISNALVALFKMFVVLFLYVFLDALFEKKRKYATKKKNLFAVPLTILCLCLMTGAVMVISNQFAVGSYVIATPSMTGELNVGDVVIYEKYDDQLIKEGQVLVFRKSGQVTIHRVTKIENINGQNRYITKGDANEHSDSGFIVASDIIGLVNYKLPFMGYPTLWLRSLFK